LTEPPRQFTVGERPAIRGESVGQGPPVVLCHGVTASRGGVLHGSRFLERAGHRVVSYDARGHGESDPAPSPQGYGYPELVGDLEAVVAATVGEAPFVLAGSSMGAHTAVAYALRHPGRLAGLVAIGPAYGGVEIAPESLAYWDGLAAALEEGGIDAFVARIGRELEIGPAWRDGVLRFTRERMLAHRDLGAVAEALRGVSRSRPFDRVGELASIDVPALVIASHDEADPGHPRAVAELYAQHLPRARLSGEEKGKSPLAWQGGALSREIAAFCAELDV